MPKPNIVHLTSVHPPRDVRIQKECQTLAQAGYKVSLIVPTEMDEMVGSVQVCAVPKPKDRIDRIVNTIRYIYKRAKKIDADIYHIHDSELLPLAQLLSFKKANLIIYDMHENVSGAVIHKEWLPPITRWPISFMFRFIEHPLIYGLNVIFAEASYCKLYPWVNNCETILNMPMVDRLLQVKELKYVNPTLGYIGAVGHLRGSLVTLEALDILKKKNKDVHWECLGPLSKEHHKELASRIASYGLEKVNIRGYTLPEKGWPIIARCHIGMALLKETSNSIESYPTKMFEYMALGLPVVTSHFPLYHRVIETERCGLCVDPENPKAIAQAISWLLDNPAEARAMGERGRKAVVEKYNWDSQGCKLLAFYESLLKQNK